MIQKIVMTKVFPPDKMNSPSINLRLFTMFTTKDIRQTRKVVKSGKSAAKSGKKWP